MAYYNSGYDDKKYSKINNYTPLILISIGFLACLIFVGLFLF